MEVQATRSVCKLYIPTWLYSNRGKIQKATKVVIYFTFQPGYIQMEQSFKMQRLKKGFTFQPGYIQIPSSKRTT